MLKIIQIMVRMAYQLFENRICLISDALRCTGMPDGEYELGGQRIFLKEHVARLADGTIAGSAMNFKSIINLSDAVTLFLAVPNLIAVFTLSPVIIKELKRYCERYEICPKFAKML